MTQIDVDLRAEEATLLADPVLRGLISAQAVWLSTHDASILRRQLVALLSRLV